MPLFLYVYLFVGCLSESVSLSITVCLCVYLSLRLCLSVSVCVYIFGLSVTLFLFVSVCLCLSVSIFWSLSLSLSVCVSLSPSPYPFLSPHYSRSKGKVPGRKQWPVAGWFSRSLWRTMSDKLPCASSVIGSPSLASLTRVRHPSPAFFGTDHLPPCPLVVEQGHGNPVQTFDPFGKGHLKMYMTNTLSLYPSSGF